MSFSGGFWATVELLVALDAMTRKQSHSPFEDDVEDWLENVSSKVQLMGKDEEESLLGDDDGVDYGNLLDCSFTYPGVKSKLESLMGTNVVRLTDRKYMLKLVTRIRQQHESKQEARMADRQENELMRTKKLILDRFLSVEEAPSEIRQYPLFQLYLYCDSIIEQRRRKSIAIRRVRIPQSLYRVLYPDNSEDDAGIGSAEGFEEDPEDVPMKVVTIRGVTQLVPMSRADIEADAKEQEIAEDLANGYLFSREEYENLHYEAEDIKNLKATKTVDEMYTKAHQIVGMLYSFSSGEKRKRCSGWNDEIIDETKSVAPSAAANEPE